MENMTNIDKLKPYVDRAVDNFGIVLTEFGIVPEDHKLLKKNPEFNEKPNAVAICEECAVFVSKPMVSLPFHLVLASVAHELAHIALNHVAGSNHKGEFEADMTTLQILAFWKIPQRSLIDLFKYMDLDNNFENRTHPSGVTRIEYLESLKGIS